MRVQCRTQDFSMGGGGLENVTVSSAYATDTQYETFNLNNFKQYIE